MFQNLTVTRPATILFNMASSLHTFLQLHKTFSVHLSTSTKLKYAESSFNTQQSHNFVDYIPKLPQGYNNCKQTRR